MTTEVSIRELVPVIRKCVENGSGAEITVTGNSMRPLLLDRVSRVLLKRADRPKRGDMVLYRRSNDTYVLHRIMKVGKDGTLVMCGDAQTKLEYGIGKDQLIASVVSFARKNKWTRCANPLYRAWVCCRIADRPIRHLAGRIRHRIQRSVEKH